MNLHKSTSPTFPLWEPPNRLEEIACGHELGVLWVKLVCAEWLMWTCERELVFQSLPLSSVGRQAAAVPGCLQRDWLMQHQERALKLAAWNCSLGWLLPWRASWVHCAGEEKGLLFSLALILSLQSCAGREWRSLLLVLKEVFASVLGAA